jgi:hypothetical protein
MTGTSATGSRRSGYTDYRTQGSSLQRSMSDDLRLVLYI